MKDYVLIGAARVTVFAFIVFALSACSESIPKSEQAKALQFSEPVAVNQFMQRIEGAWGEPKLLGSESINLTIESLISGPNLLIDDNGGLLSSWASHRNFDAQNNRYQIIQNTLMKFHVADAVLEKVAKVPTNNNAGIFHLEKSSGEIFSMWQEQNLIKTSRYQAINQWQAPQTIGQGQWGELASNQQGDVIVFIVNQQDNNRSSIAASSLSQAIPNNPSATLQRSNGSHIKQLSAIHKADNQSLIVWSELNNGVASLWSAEFSIVNGWQNVQQITLGADVSSSGFANLTLVQNPTSEDEELFFSYRQADNLILSTVSYRNGIWSTLNTLAVTNNELNPNIDVAVNDTGSMVIVWREHQQIDAQKYYQLKSRIYKPLSGWSSSTSVSQSVQGSIGSKALLNVSKPEIYVDNADNISVTWIEDGQGKSNLLVNHFDKNSNGWLIPELVVSYLSTESTIVDSSIVKSNDGKTMVAWQQKLKSTLGIEVHFWQSIKLGSGVVIEQPIQALTLQDALMIQPSAVWQAPLDVWTETIFSNTVSLIQGPEIDASDGGTGFLSLHKNSDFDPLTGGYLRQESVILNNSAPGVWTADQPFPSTSGVDSNEVEIKIADNGDAYALWLVDNILYFNNYVAISGWGTEVNLGSSDDKYNVLIDNSGNVWIFWVFGGDINLQQYIPGTGLQTADMTSVPNAWYFSTPTIDAAGAINISWISLSGLGSQPFTNTNNLNLIKYTPGAAWGFVEIAPPLNSFNSMGSKLDLVSTANDEVVAISQDTHGNIFAITYSGTNGWGNWENIDYNLDKSDHVARSLRVTSNGVNNVMVIWSEETVDVDGSLVYRIYSNRFDPVGDANGVHWPAPERVGAIVPQFDAAGQQLKQYQTLPKIAMLADGRAIATWLDSSEVGSAMYANQYTPGTGWGNTPDQVISYDRLSTGIVKSPDVTVLTSGKVLLSWRQEISTEFANEIHVWVTEGQL